MILRSRCVSLPIECSASPHFWQLRSSGDRLCSTTSKLLTFNLRPASSSHIFQTKFYLRLMPITNSYLPKPIPILIFPAKPDVFIHSYTSALISLRVTVLPDVSNFKNANTFSLRFNLPISVLYVSI